MEVSYLAHQDGMRLDRFVQECLSFGLSRESIKKKIKAKDVVLESRVGKPHTKLKKGDIIHLTIRRTTHEDEYWKGKILPLPPPKIVYEDEDLLGVNKPPRMSTHPVGRHLFYCATVYLENRHKLYSLHRLDRETSGILLMAKNLPMAQELSPRFENRQVEKAYFFIGVPNKNFKGEARFTANERIESRDISGQFYPADSKRGKASQTVFYILEIIQRKKQSYALGLAFPKTGRQHQIRLHALAHGFPLLGDKLYLGSYSLFQRFKDLKATSGDYRLMELPRQALHALAIRLPYRGFKKTFFAPLPEDIQEWSRNESLEKRLKEKVEFFFSPCH